MGEGVAQLPRPLPYFVGPNDPLCPRDLARGLSCWIRLAHLCLRDRRLRRHQCCRDVAIVMAMPSLWQKFPRRGELGIHPQLCELWAEEIGPSRVTHSGVLSNPLFQRMIAATCRPMAWGSYSIQSSTASPGTRTNSAALLVTTVIRLARAMEAIMRSRSPIWRPARAR